MVMEVRDASQPWPIELPNEDVYRGRPIEARDLRGDIRFEFKPSPWGDGWLGRGFQICTPCDPKQARISTPRHDIDRFSWRGVLGVAATNGWTLASLPPETGDGA